MTEIPNADLQLLLHATRKTAASTLAAALISASGRSYTLSEALSVFQDVSFSLWPEPNSGAYQAWKESVDRNRPY